MPNQYGRWIQDPLAPSGYRWQRHGEHPPTQMLPAIPLASELGENDDLVRRTFNGLRPDDLALEQPPQSPAWTPDDDT